ncbi:MAG: hypothetical protein CR986_04290 [Ignavibacteriae bacterium]|nr:MAG: hypothetical protein CR986_04290 [Ignavibacteriota bacterium]
MKFVNFLLLFTFLLVTSCSNKPEPNLELFSPEAFAFDVGDYWEVNAEVYAKGFDYKESGDTVISKLVYWIDLVSPKGDTLKSIFDDSIEEYSNKVIPEMSLEAQLEIDTSYVKGNYKFIFNVKDDISKQKKSITAKFELE